MAFRMKHWLVAAGAGLGLIVVWALPPDPHGIYQVATKHATEIAAERLVNSVSEANETLKRIRWGDSLTAIAVAQPPGAVFVAAPADAQPDPEWLERFYARIELERSSAPARDPDIRIGFALLPEALGGFEEVAAQHSAGEVYLGERDGVPYCIAVESHRRLTVGPRAGEVVFSFERLWMLPRDDREYSVDYAVMSRCRVPSRYGLPGPEIMDWLEAGGMRLGLQTDRARLHAEYERWQEDYVGGRLNRRPGLWVRPLEADQCLARRVEACADLLSIAMTRDMAPRQWTSVVENTRLTFVTDQQRSVFGIMDLFILDDLEREFGPVRFGRFWTSQAPFESAFEEAFGVSTGEWMLAWTAEVVGPLEAGPRPTQNAGLGALFALAFFTGLAGLTHRRRKVA